MSAKPSTEERERQLAWTVAQEAMEEHKECLVAEPPTTAQWQEPCEAGAPALARVAKVKSKEEARQLQECWFRQMGLRGALRQALHRTMVVFMAAARGDRFTPGTQR